MIKAREEKLQQIIQWATANEEIRAVLLTSSLVNPNAPSDKFSDLDIEFVIRSFDEFLKDDSWLTAFGKVIAKVVENEEAFDGKNAMRMVLYDDYVKVDFKLYRIAQFLEEVQSTELQEDWDVGYRVLIDKDNMCAGMQAPTFQSVLIKKPTKEKFEHTSTRSGTMQFSEGKERENHTVKSPAHAGLFIDRAFADEKLVYNKNISLHRSGLDDINDSRVKLTPLKPSSRSASLPR